MAVRRKAFKVARVNLNTIQSAEDRTKLEMAFAEFETARQVYVEKQRKAMQAQAAAQASQAETMKAWQAFLLMAADHFPEVAGEPVWYAFRKAGDVVLESPYTERTQRNLVRAQLQQLDSQIRNDDSIDTTGMYEDDEDNPSDEGDKHLN